MLIAFGKFVVISFIAAAAAVMPLAVLAFELENPFGWLGLMYFSLPPVIIIGLPVSFLCFVLAHKRLQGSPGVIFLMANLAGAVMLLTCYFVAGVNAMLYFGMPALIAANVYALLGWLWVIRPMGAAALTNPEVRSANV